MIRTSQQPGAGTKIQTVVPGCICTLEMIAAESLKSLTKSQKEQQEETADDLHRKSILYDSDHEA